MTMMEMSGQSGGRRTGHAFNPDPMSLSLFPALLSLSSLVLLLFITMNERRRGTREQRGTPLLPLKSSDA